MNNNIKALLGVAVLALLVVGGVYWFNGSSTQQSGVVVTDSVSDTSLSEAGTSYADKKDLVIAVKQSPDSYHPIIGTSVAWEGSLKYFTRRPFYAYDADWKKVPYALKNLVGPEHQSKRKIIKDGKEVEVSVFELELRDDLFWDDGTKVTTKDVQLGFDVLMDPKVGAGPHPTFIKDFHSMEIIDDTKFRLITNDIYCDIENTYAVELKPLPDHIERAVYEKDPAGYKKNTIYEMDITTAGLGFGPYKVSEFEQGSYLKFVLNPHWKGKKPHFETITVNIITEDATLKSNLRSGEVDYVLGELGFTFDQALSLQKQNPDQFDYVFQPGLLYEHIDVNLRHPILKEKNVRQAMAYGINREAMTTALFEGKQKVAHTNVHFLDKRIYNQNVKQYKFDAEKAKALLDEAGWVVPEGSTDGIREKDGVRLSIRITTTAGNAIREAVEQIIQSDLKKIGFELRIENELAAKFFGESLDQGNFELGMFAWASSPENIPTSVLHSNNIPTEENGFSGQNFTGYNNPEMDKVLDELKFECDRDAQVPLWHKIQDLYAEDLPVIPLYFRSNPYVFPKWLKGVRPTGHMHSSCLEVEHWYAE